MLLTKNSSVFNYRVLFSHIEDSILLNALNKKMSRKVTKFPGDTKVCKVVKKQLQEVVENLILLDFWEIKRQTEFSGGKSKVLHMRKIFIDRKR